jgi:hypothetical protein
MQPNTESTSKSLLHLIDHLLFDFKSALACGPVQWYIYGQWFSHLPLYHRPFYIHFDEEWETMLTKAASRRTTHTLQMYSMYLTYRDKAKGQDPYFNREIVRVFEDLLRRGPHGLLRADALSWLAKAARARGERDSAERYMRDLIELLLGVDVNRNSLARSFMNDLETWLIEWGESGKASEVAAWRDQELGAEATA